MKGMEKHKKDPKARLDCTTNPAVSQVLPDTLESSLVVLSTHKWILMRRHTWMNMKLENCNGRGVNIVVFY